jgi:serine/threonine-protein kinase
MAQRFGRFWLHEKIGQGGMAEIFRATIGPDPQTYAFDLAVTRLPTVLTRDTQQVDMFMTEADIAKFLRHPNLVRVYESGIVDEQAYIAMEYVWGLDLAQLMTRLRARRLRFPTDLAVFVGLQVLRGLDYVHRAHSPGGESMEMIHRDVTPSNIYVTFDGKVKLGDFGVARVKFLEAHEDQRMLKGKIGYMPPEVIAGAPLDQRVDLWGLACSLYEMITGKRVYDGVSESDLAYGAVPPRIVPAHKVNPEVDAGLSAVLSAALHMKARKRPRDAVALYRDLKGYMVESGIRVDADALDRFARAATGMSVSQTSLRTGPTTESFSTPAYEAPAGMSMTQRIEIARRRRVLVPMLMAVLVALALYAGWMLGQRTHDDPKALPKQGAPKG